MNANESITPAMQKIIKKRIFNTLLIKLNLMDKKIVQVGKFVLILVFFYVFLSFLISFIPLEWIELITAKAVAVFTGGKIVFQEPVLILFENYSIQISYLCTGLMEFIVLASAVIATGEITKEKKAIGVIGAGITTFLFNTARIIITVFLIKKTDLQTIELAHDLLFRISLFVLIAGYYFAWYYLSVKGIPESIKNKI